MDPYDLHVKVLCCASLALVLVAACTAGGTNNERADRSSSSSEPDRFGAAQVAPATVRVGDRFAVTPDGAVQPICLNPAVVLQVTNSDRERVGILSPDGSWQGYNTGPDPTIAACLPAESAHAQSYEVPPAMRSGDYIVCLTWEPTSAGCGVLTVGG